MRVDSQPAYILHTRPYRDSSLLVEALTSDYGRISAVVRGVRANGKSARQRRSLIQPFTPLLIAWSGNTDLKTLLHVESRSMAIELQGRRLFSALYINELLVRVLPNYAQHPELFSLYEWVLQTLCRDEHIDVPLRRFELSLLESLGYGVDLTTEAESGLSIAADNDYRLDLERGFIVDQNLLSVSKASQPLFRGKDIIALHEGNFTTSTRSMAKRLCRLLLQPHLGNKPLKSRELFS